MPPNKVSGPKIRFFDPVSSLEEKFDFYTKVVIGILVFAMLTLLVMVATLVIDSFHFNSATYTEYSNKLGSIDNLSSSTKMLLQQNKQNQDLIIKQQQEILQIL